MKLGYESPVTTIPNPFIDNYMSTCPPTYALIYFYSLRRVQDGEAMTMKNIASHFNILETDVHNAWRHWEKTGIVTIDGDAPEMNVTFLPPEQWGKITPMKISEKTTVKPSVRFIPVERPQYIVEELTQFREKSSEVKSLFNRAEETLGKLLTYHDMNVLFGFYDWLRLPVDVLDFLLAYCADHDHRDLRYIEKCAMDWADKGISDVNQAQEYLQTFDMDYRTILQTFGQNTGYPTPTQKKYIEKWRKEWKVSTTLIMEACDRSGVYSGKPKFAYVDKILTTWHNAGVTTMEGVLAMDEIFEKAKEAAKETAKTPIRPMKAKSTRFANFTQRKNDYSQFEQLQRDYILKELQG
jgi:DnaD/phage-associated family protein